MAIINIKLNTDAYIATGLALNSYIGGDVVYNEYGLAYIPASRLKGALRKSAICLKDWGLDIDIDIIFGSINNKASLILEDARLVGYDSMKKAIIENSDKNYINAQAVIEQFTNIRGVKGSKGQSRFRVLNRGLEFEAYFTIDEKYKDEFEKCVKGLKHIGSGKSKGLGEIVCSIDWSKDNKESIKQAPIFDDSKNYETLEYSITLLEKLVNKLPYDNDSSSKHFIEGRMMAGYIASILDDKYDDLKKDDTLHFSNAYLAINNKRSLPSPVSFKVKKLDKKDLRDCLSNGKRNDDNDQLKVMGETFVADITSNNISSIKAISELEYHHTAKQYDGQSKYHIDALKEGQTFKGFISGHKDTLKKIYEVINNNPITYMGSFTTSGYGKVKVEIDDLKEKEVLKENKCDEFIVYFLSPMILLNKDGLYSSDCKEFIKLLEERLNGVKLESIKQFQRLIDVSSYNTLVNENRPLLKALDKGCIYRIKTINNEKIDISKIAHTFFGEENRVGFGEVVTLPIMDNYYRSIKEVDEYKPLIKDSDDDYGDRLINNIATNYILDIAKQMGVIDAGDVVKSLPIDILETQANMVNTNIPKDELLKTYFDSLYDQVLLHLNKEDDYGK